MVRTQIQLTEEQSRKLKERALSDHESVAALIRKAIDSFLITGKPDRAALYRQAAGIVGKFKTEPSDISVNHDEYLDQAYRS